MFETIIDIYALAKKNCPEQIAFSSGLKFDQHMTYLQVWSLAKAQSFRLKHLGLRPGDEVAILASSSWKWEIAQLSILMCRGVVVGIDPNDSAVNYKRIQKNQNIKFLLCDDDYLSLKWNQDLETKWTSQPLVDNSFLHVDDDKLTDSFEEIQSDDLAIIIFTSGTTSEPKGIAYTHKKVALAVESIVGLYPEISNSPTTVCWLPLANLFQRVLNFATVANFGQICFVENPASIATFLPLISPHVFISVPRFFEKVFDSIMSKVEASPLPIRIFLKFGFWWAEKIWLLNQKHPNFRFLKLTLLPWNVLIFNKIRSLYGQRIQFLISGSAPMRLDLLRFYHSIELPVYEAYGTSENTVPIAANTKSHCKLGSVGKPVIENSIKIADDGEILVRSEGLFSNYWGQDINEKIVDGYYKTGDLGLLDQEGFLHIHGRKTEMFKTTTGKKIGVSEIEKGFKGLTFVDQVVVLGEGRKFPIVLLTLDFNQLASFLGASLSAVWDIETGTISASYVKDMEKAVRSTWRSLPTNVKPGGAIVLTRRLSLAQNEITPNLKIRRKAIERLFETAVDNLYIEAEENSEFPIHFLSSEGQFISNSIPTRPLVRWAYIFRLIGQILMAQISHQLGFSTRRQLYRRTGQFFRRGLGGLRGPMQKVGQMLSQLAEDLPSEIREELGQLFTESHLVNPNLIRSIVEKEFNKPIPAIFSEWKDDPISTASIGQVHWARLISGEEVAVKVLLPGVERALATDLSALRIILPILRRILNFASLESHYSELSEMFLQECNFKNEADNYRFFGRIFENHPEIYIPKVYSKFSTQRVLTTEFIHGDSFESFASKSTQEEKNRIAAIIWTSASLSINQCAIFNADPHPGNYLILDSRVAMVDFGFCKKWNFEFIQKWKKQILASCNNDVVNFEIASRSLGITNKENPNFYIELNQINHEILYKPWLAQQPFHFTNEWVKEYLRALFKYQISVQGLKIPHEFLALSRLYWGMFNLMAKLDATCDFRKITIPFIEKDLDQTFELQHTNDRLAQKVSL